MQRTSLRPVPGTAFPFFLASLGLSNFGDTLRAIALVVLLFKLTGSGLSASLCIVYSLIPGILLSIFAGGIGDRLSEKHVLIALELARSAVITLFNSVSNVPMIYALLFILASLDALGSPSFKKITVSILGKDNVVKGNSYMSGVTGLTNILGSSFAGIFTALWGIESVFLLNSVLHVISAILLFGVNVKTGSTESTVRRNASFSLTAIRLDSKICNDPVLLRSVVSAFAAAAFLGISTSIAFYPFSFDVLKVTDKGWGAIMSVFYGSNILAMFIYILLRKRLKQYTMKPVYAMLLVVSFVWFLYSSLNSLVPVLVLQILEGTALSLCGIFLVSNLQIVAKTGYMARVAGINDFISNIGRMLGTGYAYIVIGLMSVRFIFIVNSLCLFAYSLYHLLLCRHTCIKMSGTIHY